MKNLKTLLLTLALSISCYPQRADLSVTNGSGDAKIRGRQTVHVWADPNPPGMVFDRWTGDTALAQNPREYHTKVNVLSLNVALTANYKSAPVWNPTYETINNSLVGYYFPAAPGGVIFHFHGTGGSANGLFGTLEQRTFADEAVAENYAVVSLNSVDRINRQWNANPQLENNPDMQNVRAALDLFAARGWISASTPVFANGISNGGAFAPRVSRALGFRGTSIFIAAGAVNVLSQTTVPTIWNLMRNDNTIGADGISQAAANYQNLLGRGIPAQYNILDPAPIYPEKFRRISGFSAADSQAVYDALNQNGFLDARDYLLQSPNVSAWASVIPPPYNARLNEIEDQLKIAYTEHNFYSDHDRRVLDFFNARR